MKIKVLPRGEILPARMASAKGITARQAHKQILKNGGIAGENPFYIKGKTEEESFRKLDEE